MLATIVAATRRIVEERKEREGFAQLIRRAEGCRSAAGRLRLALGRPDRINVIAECKRRSPSKGVLCERYDPAAIARGYASAGAAAVSVLTEPTFFDGSLDHLDAVRRAVELPLLRKDFIVSAYQVAEARAAGADAVLLIVAALSQGDLRALAAGAAEMGMDALVEVHDRQELERAVDAGAEIIGVNNRDLRTLELDIRVSEELIPRMPRQVVAVSESGLRTPDDLTRLRQLGFGAFLVGERLMVEDDPGAALRTLLAAAATTEDTKDTKVRT